MVSLVVGFVDRKLVGPFIWVGWLVSR